MKVCSRCRINKEQHEFLFRKNNYYGYCKDCRTELNLLNKEKRQEKYSKNKEYVLERQKQYNNKNQEKIAERKYNYWRKNKERLQLEAQEKRKNLTIDELNALKNKELIRKYGISLEERDILFKEQGEVCAICKSKESKSVKDFCVDHCHLTLKVRGILCHGCNKGIGHFQEDTNALHLAIDYLESHNSRGQVE